MALWSDEDVAALLGSWDRTASGASTRTRSSCVLCSSPERRARCSSSNLLSYHAAARYPEGHELARAGLSGADAYGRYGAVALDHVVRRGGTLVLYNDVLQVLIGRTAPWDQIAIMQYPGIDAFVDMIRDPDYQAGLVHRDAGLAETAILVSRPLL